MPLGARSVLLPQEDEWKLMADQDPHPDSVAGDSGHGTMTVETEPVADNEELIRAVGGLMRTPPLNTVLMSNGMIEINDENVTIHRTPAASSTAVPVLNESEMLLPADSPGGKRPCFRELMAVLLSKSAPPLCLKLDYSNAELVRYTQSPLTSVIP